jgi:cytochrome c oxidase subunit 2
VRLLDGSVVLADDGYLRESILRPAEKVVAGYQPVMPTYQGQVSEEQLLQLIAYIKTLGAAGPAGAPEGQP